MSSAASTQATMEGLAIAVVTTSGCKYCKRAKEALSRNNIGFEEIEVQGDIELLTTFREASGLRTVPQIFLSGKCFGGSDEVVAALEDGSFQQLLSQATEPALTPTLREAVEKSREKSAALAQAAGGADNSELKGLEALAALMADPSTGVPKTSTQVRLWKKETNVFSAESAAQWLTSTQPSTCPTPADAYAKLAQVQSANLLYDISHQPAAAADPLPISAANAGGLYRLTVDAPAPCGSKPLNAHYPWFGPARPATQVAADLRGLILELYDKYLSPDGRAVSYKRMATDPLWSKFVDATAELQKVDLEPLSRDELMSMAINLYNVLIIHATVVLGAPTSTLERLKFFSRSCKYLLAGQVYTADDLEHGILRANQPAPAAFFRKTQFKEEDVRSKKVLTTVDPRIHFALVCGAKSCPPIRLYTPESLEEGLQGAAEAFCSGEVEVDADTGTVTLSMIFKWYGKDFGTTEPQMLQALLKYLPEAQRVKLEGVLAKGDKLNVVYKPYDWSLNSDE